MSRPLDTHDVVGRRLKLRDLHVFLMVVEHGSMAKAAAQLRVTQPAVSQVILDLEAALGIKLLDRGPRGTEPTDFGRALAKGGLVAFDNLRQTIKEIAFLANPTVGDVRIGCPETVAAILHPTIEQLARDRPGLVVHVIDVVAPTLDVPALLGREIDIALLRITQLPKAIKVNDELQVEVLFNDEICVVAARGSAFARKRKIAIRDLVDATWVLPPRGSLNRTVVIDAFQSAGLAEPRMIAETFSMQLRTNLLASGHCLTVLPRSVMRLQGDDSPLVVLPVELPQRDWPVVMVTLKNRTLNPVAEVFMKAVRTGFGALAAKASETRR